MIWFDSRVVREKSPWIASQASTHIAALYILPAGALVYGDAVSDGVDR